MDSLTGVRGIRYTLLKNKVELSVNPITRPPCRKIRLRSVNEFSVSPIHGPPCRTDESDTHGPQNHSSESQESRPGGYVSSQSHDLEVM